MNAVVFAVAMMVLAANAELVSESARNAISLPVAPLFAGGVSVQGERFTESLRWSSAVSLGARSSVSGDYGGVNISLGLEARHWWHIGPLSKSAAFGDVGGAFVWLRGDAVWVRLEREGAFVGSAIHPAASAGVGYRFLPVWRLALTPLVGGAFDFSARRFTLSLGLTVGVVF